MYKCPKCDTVKPLTEFHSDRSSKRGHCGYCKMCRNKKAQKRYQENKQDPTWGEKAKEWQKKHYAEGVPVARRYVLKKRLVELLDGQCSKCGYDKCLAALDFHHVNHDGKDGRIADLLNTKSLNAFESALDELESKDVVLLCSNCHREAHQYKSEQKSRELIADGRFDKLQSQITELVEERNKARKNKKMDV